MNEAPDSQEVIQLNAENFEKQHDLKKAIAEYRVLLQRAPEMPGIHYRIAGLIMSQPPTAASAEEARKEFEAELKIFPGNAGAEYYLGELAELYPSFAETHLGLGRCLLDSGNAKDAAPPFTSLSPPPISGWDARKTRRASSKTLRKNVSGAPAENHRTPMYY